MHSHLHRCYVHPDIRPVFWDPDHPFYWQNNRKGEKGMYPVPFWEEKHMWVTEELSLKKPEMFLWSKEKRLQWTWGKGWMMAQLKSPPTFWPSIQASLVNGNHPQNVACTMCSYNHICGSKHSRNIRIDIENQRGHLVQGLASGQSLQMTEEGSCKSLYTISWCAKKGTVSYQVSAYYAGEILIFASYLGT